MQWFDWKFKGVFFTLYSVSMFVLMCVIPRFLKVMRVLIVLNEFLSRDYRILDFLKLQFGKIMEIICNLFENVKK